MKPKILVVGDVMLDRYIHGVVERISPEAPIPILRQTHTEDRPGGAANVAMNLASLGAEVQLIANFGDDWAMKSLADLLEAGGVHHDGMADGATAIKTRFVAMGQQMLRVDNETASVAARNRRNLDSAILGTIEKRPNALVLSDYGMGVLNESTPFMITNARELGIPVYVDPKGTDWSRYRGATLIKPNEAELRAVVGYQGLNNTELLGRGCKLLRELGIEHMLLTLGAAGMTWINNRGDFHHQPAVSGPVVDVTGAGDTVLAVVAWVRHAFGDDAVDWPSILGCAALGAAAVCSRPGTSLVTQTDLRLA